MKKQKLTSFLKTLSDAQKRDLFQLLESQIDLSDNIQNNRQEDTESPSIKTPKSQEIIVVPKNPLEIGLRKSILFPKAMISRIIKNIEIYRNYLFLLLLVAVYLILDYQTILFSHPQGIHFWRQTDSLSFVANYYKNGFDFCHPRVFSLLSTDGKAACEFPILYYITALVYLIFNEHEFILRLITITIASTGFFYLFKLLYSFLHDFAYASGFSFLFISSTVLLYYTNNFLPDASTLGMTLIAWYFFFIFLKNRNNKNALNVSFVFFSIASLIKVTYFINPVAAILSLLAYDFLEKKDIKSTITHNIKPLLFFSISLIAVLFWNLYVIHYNKINNDHAFLIQSRPIWSINKVHIAQVWEHITNYWYSSYYYSHTFQVFSIIIVTGIIFLKKAERIVLIPSIILAIGSICYFLLFFAQFKDHDYYFIALIPGMLFLVINSFIAIKNKFPSLINHYAGKLLLLALCMLSLNFAKGKLTQRYEKTDDMYANIGYTFSKTRHYMDSLGISENAKVIIIADHTPNGGLYFINRPGWSLGDDSESSMAAVNDYIQKGAEYILFTDQKYIYKGFIGTKIGENNGVSIYKLPKMIQTAP